MCLFARPAGGRRPCLQVLVAVKEERKACRDISKLMAIVGVLCHLVGHDNTGALTPTTPGAMQVCKHTLP